jgi:hypothetical protein
MMFRLVATPVFSMLIGIKRIKEKKEYGLLNHNMSVLLGFTQGFERFIEREFDYHGDISSPRQYFQNLPENFVENHVLHATNSHTVLLTSFKSVNNYGM